ncbi:MAG: hypothetical protein L6R35_006292 [Caloplaca aegaea]|nr:MAG: hypothetical protein L6R35_006292 [Caloplaca aegaea]
MLKKIITVIFLLASHHLPSPVSALAASQVVRNQALRPATCSPADRSAPLANLSSLLLTEPITNHRTISYPIPRTTQVLRVRVFTCRSIEPLPLHRALEGALSLAQQRLTHQGPNARLLTRNNPFTYGVHGCYFEMTSRKARDGLPGMTWKMMRDVLLALQQVLERDRNWFEAGFVLAEATQGGNWGHGQVLQEVPMAQVADS